jgi:hypothetical protein
MKKELSQKSRNRISTGSWVLIALQGMILVGLIIDKQERDPAIEALVQTPTTLAIAGTLGSLIGINALAIVALIGGLTLWRHDRNKESKIITILAIFALIFNSTLAFL